MLALRDQLCVHCTEVSIAGNDLPQRGLGLHGADTDSGPARPHSCGGGGYESCSKRGTPRMTLTTVSAKKNVRAKKNPRFFIVLPEIKKK